jgi:hypothetical protein
MAIRFFYIVFVFYFCFCTKTNAQVWQQIGQDIDGEFQHDHSGSSVSLSNDGLTVAIGAQGNDGGGANSGQVRIYQYNGANWLQIGQDINGEFSQDFSGDYWSVSLSADGTIVAIGAAKNNNSNGSDAGHVRVYQYNSGTNLWVKLGQDIDGENGNDQSGKSVYISDDGQIVAIGAPQNDGNGSNSGHVRVYQYDGSNWIQLGQDIDGESGADQSGGAVSLNNNGTIVAIGASGNDNIGGSNAGHVRVYQYNGISWVQKGQDIDGTNGGDMTGWNVSISGDGLSLVVADRLHNGNGSNSGRARAFQYNGTSWIQKGQDINGEFANDGCWAVSISDDASTIAYSSKDNTSNVGSVRVYKYSAGNWIQQGLDIDGENSDFSGYSVSFSSTGDTIAIGAIYNDGSFSNAGHVRVYELTTPLPITLLSFDGEYQNNYNLLDWTTSSEINNDYFTLESSRNAIIWDEVVKINGAGNSNNEINYKYQDYNYFKSRTYYRLKQTDFDGKTSYSNTIVVELLESNSNIIMYPNPTKDNLYIKIPNNKNNYQMIISDYLGKQLLTQKLTQTKTAINLNGFSKGVYFIKIITKNKTIINNKIVKQ